MALLYTLRQPQPPAKYIRSSGICQEKNLHLFKNKSGLLLPEDIR